MLSALKNRPYVNLAIFWGRYESDQFKPENASQHGRLYLPTASEPAIVVATVPDMQKKSNPIPTELGGFAAVWTLGRRRSHHAQRSGIPWSLGGLCASDIVRSTAPRHRPMVRRQADTHMLYMVIETFRSGDPVPVYRRFKDRGRLMPEGIEYRGSWVTDDLRRCFQVMECQDRSLLDQWMANWNDIMEFEVVPLVTSAEAVATVAPRL